MTDPPTAGRTVAHDVSFFLLWHMAVVPVDVPGGGGGGGAAAAAADDDDADDAAFYNTDASVLHSSGLHASHISDEFEFHLEGCHHMRVTRSATGDIEIKSVADASMQSPSSTSSAAPSLMQSAVLSSVKRTAYEADASMLPSLAAAGV